MPRANRHRDGPPNIKNCEAIQIFASRDADLLLWQINATLNLPAARA